MSSDLAGVWEVALSDGVHRIEFEHGTTTGKRVIYVDGKVWITVVYVLLAGKETNYFIIKPDPLCDLQLNSLITI